jgi:hypothetical protein
MFRCCLVVPLFNGELWGITPWMASLERRNRTYGRVA